nr:MAG TPA: hypothetical protein [Caudoviricetes sp.]
MACFIFLIVNFSWCPYWFKKVFWFLLFFAPKPCK